METWEIEETLSRTRLRPPKTIFVLSSPIIAPQLKAVVYGLNPNFEKETIVLAGNAARETVIHETLHSSYGLGELLTYPLAKIITRFRTVFPAKRGTQVRYQERTLSSEELKKYGLQSYMERDGYAPTQLTVKQLSLVEG